MELIIKAFTSIFFLCLLAFLGIGILGASLDARNAETFMSDCVWKMQNSHCADEVIEECKNDANNQGYDLNIATYGAMSEKRCATIQLKYQYAVDILGIKHQQVVYANVR